MTTNVALGSTSKRLVELYTAILGANVGLLPVLMVFLFREAELPNKLAQLPWRSVVDSAADGKVTMPAELALLLWVLTTVIVIHEWWLSVNFFYEYDLDKGGVNFAALQIIVNVIYLVPLLSLSALLKCAPIYGTSQCFTSTLRSSYSRYLSCGHSYRRADLEINQLQLRGTKAGREVFSG